MPELQFEYSSWLVLGCLLVGLGYAYFLYSKKSSWNISTNRILFFLRFLSVSFILILLLNPLLKQFITQIERPIVAVAVDNSLSITNSVDSTSRSSLVSDIQSFVDNLTDDEYEVHIRTLDGEKNSLEGMSFDQKTTDLNSMFREIQAYYDGKNLASTVLISDGNYNRGISPAYFPYNYKIYTVGIGDTTRKEDVVLKNVLFNKIAYQGNKFPVVAEVANTGFEGESAEVEVSKNGKVIASEIIEFKNDIGLSNVEFNIDAENAGMQHYVVNVAGLDELVTENNRRDIYIDVIDGKQKILMIAPAPHPDIKAMRSVVESNENYEFDTHIPGTSKLEDKEYDLVIVHQVSDRSNRLKQLTQKFKKDAIPVLNIVGINSNVARLSGEDELFNFKAIRNQRDQVSPSINSEFSKFKLDPDFNQIFVQFPTVNVPYGELQPGPQTSVLLYQRVGSVSTNKPLLFVDNDDSRKSAYLLSDGIWQWRLQEYAMNENTKAFDNVFLKLIQYLSTKEDKRKFRVLTTRDEYYDNEAVSFDVEIYNDSYERVYGDNVQMKIYDDKGAVSEYSFIPSVSNSTLEISGLQQGIYSYEATLDRNESQEKVSGQFTVKVLQLELLDQQANFNLLRQISAKSDGQFFTPESLEALSSVIKELNSKGIMHSDEDFFPLINLKWLFALILILLSVEWFTRKYVGGY
ncbi:MAG: VWA domain-containing protein [Cyclobacteriaceae bacterium]